MTTATPASSAPIPSAATPSADAAATRPTGPHRSRHGRLDRHRGDLPFALVNGTVFAALAFLCGYPFYYLIINAISANDVSALGDIRFLPQGMHLGNYRQVFQLDGLPQAALVSFARTAIGTAATVLASAYLGFMFTQPRLWKRAFWYRAVVITID